MNETEQVSLYEWLSTIPFSRVKKNLARDFCDGVLAAELIKHFLPTLVDLHNYPTTNRMEQKKVNWETLSRKVLRKLAIPLSDATINELAGANRDAIEYFLNKLRKTIETNEKSKLNRVAKENKIRDLFHSLNIEDTVIDVKVSDEHMQKKDFGDARQNSDSSSRSKLLQHSATVSRVSYEEKVEELLSEKQATITNLTARVHDLEYLVLHKDHIINELRGQLKGYCSVKDAREKGDGRNVKPKKNTSTTSN